MFETGHGWKCQHELGLLFCQSRETFIDPACDLLDRGPVDQIVAHVRNQCARDRLGMLRALDVLPQSAADNPRQFSVQ